MLIESHAIEAEIFRQKLFIEVFMVEFVAFGRIKKAVRCSEKTLLNDSILRRVAVGAFSEISQMHFHSSIDCCGDE